MEAVELPASVAKRKTQQTEQPLWPSAIRAEYVKCQKLTYVEYKCSRIVQYTSTVIRYINFTFNNYSIHISVISCL